MGRAAITNDHFRPLFNRITDDVVSLLHGGHAPPRDWDDPVQWRQRCYNKRADWLANQALDAKKDFKYVDPDAERYAALQPNWLACTDGACRRVPR